MLRRPLFTALFSMILFSVFGQYQQVPQQHSEDQDRISYPQSDSSPVKLNRYFIGGNFIAGFGSDGGAFGVNPSIGYTVNPYLDLGIGLNAVYNYSKLYDQSKIRTWNLGIAPFVRVYPINLIFFQGEFQENAISSRIIAPDGTKGDRQNVTAPSIIASIGYTNRIFGQSSFFFSVGMDLLNNPNSPYREQYYDNNSGTYRSRALPIIRSGFNINLW